MKTKIVSIILLFSLLAPAILTLYWLESRKSKVKNEVAFKIRKGIEKKELVLLKFSRKEAETKLNWEHSEEFEYNYEMYDVVEINELQDSIHYLCWWDHEETEIKKQIEKTTQHIFQFEIQKKEKHQQLFVFYKSLFYVEKMQWDCLIPALFNSQNYSYTNKQSNYFNKPSLPPPKLN